MSILNGYGEVKKDFDVTDDIEVLCKQFVERIQVAIVACHDLTLDEQFSMAYEIVRTIDAMLDDRRRLAAIKRREYERRAARVTAKLRKFIAGMYDSE